MNKKLLIPVIAATLYGSNAMSATSYTGEDYLAIHVEAEAYDSKDERWYYFDLTTNPSVPPDRDGNHASTASGKAYLEVLPDRRVYGDERDEVLDEDGNVMPIGGLWMAAGTGPRLNYTVDFPEAGRYVVHVRGLKNNTEDNSVHAGINNKWPNAGPLQLSCFLNNTWHWRSARRTNENHCGDDNIPIYIDVPSAGQHTVMFSAREDGYEQDSFFLIKDLSNNTRICAPANLTDITCKNGSYDVVDGFVDVSLSVSAGDTNLLVGTNVEITHVIGNEDSLETANDTSFSVNLPAAMEFVSANSNDCSMTGSVLTCSSGDLRQHTEQEYVITYKLLTVGSVTYQAVSSVTQPDDNSTNNSGAIGFQVFADGPKVDAQLELTANKQIIGVDDIVSLTATVTNFGEDTADASSVQFSLPTGATLISSTIDCGAAPTLSCDIGSLATLQSKSVTLDVTFSVAGENEVTASVSASNDYNASNDNSEIALYSSNSELFEEANGQLVAEAEVFAAHQAGTTQSGNGWYLVSDSMQPAASLYAESNVKDTASSNSYVVALERGESGAPFDGGTAATLSYRVFFNTVGTYYLQARGYVTEDAGDSIHYALDGNWDQAVGALSWCDAVTGWSWANATESAGNCQSTTAASIEVTTPGEHVLSLSIHDAGVEVDKLVISNDASLVIEGIGPDSTLYADKAVDLALTSSITELSIEAGVESVVDVIVTNNNATAAASDVHLTVTGLEAVAQPESTDLNCQLIEDGEAAYKLECDLEAIGPGESVQAALPIMVAAQGDSSATITVSAMQSDDRADNDTHIVAVSASSADGQGKASGGGGAMTLSLALIGLMLLSLRAIVHRRTA